MCKFKNHDSFKELRRDSTKDEMTAVVPQTVDNNKIHKHHYGN